MSGVHSNGMEQPTYDPESGMWFGEPITFPPEEVERIKRETAPWPPVPTFEDTLRQVDRAMRAGPADFRNFEQKVAALAREQSSWRRHPLRRSNVERQHLQIAVGDWLLSTFPFTRRPAEWAVRQMERLSR